MIAYLTVSSFLMVSPPRLLIRRISRSAVRSRSRSPQEENVRDTKVPANLRDNASLARSAVSRSGAFAASSLVFSTIEKSLSRGRPFSGEVRGADPPALTERKYLPSVARTAAAILARVEGAPLICFHSSTYLNTLRQELRPFPVGST